MNFIAKFFHELWNPHCSSCTVEYNAKLDHDYMVAREDEVCESCEILKRQLEIVNEQTRHLLDRMLEKKEEKEPIIPQEAYKPIMPRHTPWAVRQAMLEQEDRERARILQGNMDAQKSISDLESELKIVEAVRNQQIESNLEGLNNG